MERLRRAEALIASRARLESDPIIPTRKQEAEGGCGVIGIAASVPIPGRHLLQALQQMRNRGNGKGGGIAAVGLDPDFFGVAPEVLMADYLLAVAYLDPAIRPQVEASHIEPTFIVDHVFSVPTLPDFRTLPGLEVRPPDVYVYFVRVRPDVRTAFMEQAGLPPDCVPDAEDEIVYQNTYRLNRTYYAATGDKRAFVLSHGKNLLILKLVGYGDDVVRYYCLEDLRAHVWIGHHRYPTKGKVWHPGGAHPFLGMHEALVHNGDFANYASICTYLAQRNVYPLFLTDTEVAVLVFDLLHRVYGYPLEYVIEAMAPTTERDFALLPPDKQRVYRMLQAVHMHGSPDGPWFFLVAQSAVRDGTYRLIGITDTSMLRPQVFALQRGTAAVGFAASEKQAIDAALESLAREDARFWSHADLYWNARGGSHTDGGAFIFTVAPAASDARRAFLCTDKFGRPIDVNPAKRPPTDYRNGGVAALYDADLTVRLARRDETVEALWDELREHLPRWDYADVQAFLESLEWTVATDDDRQRVLTLLTLLMDRRYPTGSMKRSYLLSLVTASFARVLDGLRRSPSRRFTWVGWETPLPDPRDADTTVVIDARGFPAEGPQSLARAIVTLYRRGFRRFIVAHTRGQRFIGCGLGPGSWGVRIDVYGSSGDYLASGLDGAEVVVHGSAQDQLAQIMKDGTLVVYGDVGQTFMYAAKGGRAFILGNAAGRPLINAVGRPRVVINGTCLDYLAESFMAGDPLQGGGFVVLNGVALDEDGHVRELDTPYPGGNLFSLASGGAIYVRDPYRRLTEDQLNGGEFTELTPQDWDLIRPYLEENERIFGIPLERLLTVDGRRETPERVYRKVRPAGHKALLPEEAWVKREA
jgi:glutamate synthase domain-containing protein 1/glutamate synthase domain-containing protein 3